MVENGMGIFEMTQEVNELIDGKTVAATSKIPRRFQPGYDVSTIRSTIKLINFVDRTDIDYLDFGVEIVSKFFAKLYGEDTNWTEEDENGQIYVSNNIEFNNDRTFRASITTTPFDTIFLQMSVYPVINL